MHGQIRPTKLLVLIIQFLFGLRGTRVKKLSFIVILLKFNPFLFINIINIYLKPPLPKCRIDLINKAFQKLDKNGDGNYDFIYII